VTRVSQVFIALVALAAATALDGLAYEHIVLKNVYETDWGRLLRIIGFLPTWAIVAVALMQASAPPQNAAAQPPSPRWRGALPLISATLGGLVAEVLKILLRRERPSAHGGAYVFRDWSERTFSSGGLALPSSHVLVAFAGAAMLARMQPRLAWLAFGLAAGCALTRIMARAHFLSDVVLAALLGWLVAELLWRWTKRGTQLFARRGV
jgi:membrane-associated phospholipid phosphatase